MLNSGIMTLFCMQATAARLWLSHCSRRHADTQTALKIYTVSTENRKRPLSMQLQFNGMNICTSAIKLPILLKISATVIKILTFNNWSSKVYRFY